MVRDLTQGSVTKLLLVFAFPLLLSNLLQTVYNMVDMVVIGQFVGKTGLSAVSIGGDVMHLTLFLAMGFANAGSFSDLKIWSVFCIVLAIINLLSIPGKKKAE